MTGVPIESASEISGVPIHTLRYWEAQFPVLSPSRTDGGQRRYQTADFEVVFEIKRLLKRELMTIAGAKRAMAR